MVWEKTICWCFVFLIWHQLGGRYTSKEEVLSLTFSYTVKSYVSLSKEVLYLDRFLKSAFRLWLFSPFKRLFLCLKQFEVHGKTRVEGIEISHILLASTHAQAAHYWIPMPEWGMCYNPGTYMDTPISWMHHYQSHRLH